MAKADIPTREEATREAKMLCLKLFLCGPDRFSITDMGKLTELLTNEGFLK